MKHPYTVWLEPDEEDWVRMFGGGSDFSSSLRALVRDHRRRQMNRENGVLKRILNRKGPEAWAKFGWLALRRPEGAEK